MWGFRECGVAQCGSWWDTGYGCRFVCDHGAWSEQLQKKVVKLGRKRTSWDWWGWMGTWVSPSLPPALACECPDEANAQHYGTKHTPGSGVRELVEDPRRWVQGGWSQQAWLHPTLGAAWCSCTPFCYEHNTYYCFTSTFPCGPETHREGSSEKWSLASNCIHQTGYSSEVCNSIKLKMS